MSPQPHSVPQFDEPLVFNFPKRRKVDHALDYFPPSAQKIDKTFVSYHKRRDNLEVPNFPFFRSEMASSDGRSNQAMSSSHSVLSENSYKSSSISAVDDSESDIMSFERGISEKMSHGSWMSFQEEKGYSNVHASDVQHPNADDKGQSPKLVPYASERKVS